MFRNLRNISLKKNFISFVQKQTFLTNDYQCKTAWNSQISSSVLSTVNLHDFFNNLDQNYTSKGVISAIDVDVFANSVKEPAFLEELKDLLHKLRLSAETGNTLDSTHHATIRSYIEFGYIEELINILKDPLNYGVFLDEFSTNILLNKLLTSQQYEQAAHIAILVMLQEDYHNEISCTMSQYACYKYITGSTNKTTTENPPLEEKPKKVEEIKIRVKFLRNPYYDDHFDIKDSLTASGKVLAWISKQTNDNLNNNLQIIGWLLYKKYDKLLAWCEKVSKMPSSKIYTEVIDLLKMELNKYDAEINKTLDQCLTAISLVPQAETPLEGALKNSIENAINKNQTKDISSQEKLFKLWEKIREDKLEEQTKRLDRAKRIELIENKQKAMAEEEQTLWFFENEEKIDLEIEEKEKLVDISHSGKKKTLEKSDENYIPPEILPKRK